jgi:hypothetical protein
VQTSRMLRKFLLAVLVSSSALLAQQPASSSPDPQVAGASSKKLSNDPAKVASLIGASYYHPDELGSLGCSVSVDWPAFFTAMKLTLPENRLKSIQGLKIQSRAIRNKIPDITFDWTGGPLDNAEQFESGIKQMISGYYQIYWPMVASSPLAGPSDLSRIDLLPDGGATTTSLSPNMTTTITIDRVGTPTHYAIDGAAMKATIDPHYAPSLNPVSGDLRRISSLDVKEQIGTSTINVRLSLDYQEVDGFNVPKHVSFDLLGAYSINMEFFNCKTTARTAP